MLYGPPGHAGGSRVRHDCFYTALHTPKPYYRTVSTIGDCSRGSQEARKQTKRNLGLQLGGLQVCCFCSAEIDEHFARIEYSGE